MYIYNKIKDKVEIYKVMPNVKEIYDYKKELMNKINEEKRIIATEIYTDPYFNQLFFEDYQSLADEKVFKPNEVFFTDKGAYQRYQLEKESELTKEEKHKLIDKLCHGEFINQTVFKIDYGNKLRYLLLTKNKYKAYLHNNRYLTMEGIIDIPEDIYILQLIEAGKISKVEKQNFYDMLNLFDFSFENQVDIKYLEELSKCNLVNNTYKNFIDKESSKAPNFIKEIKKRIK